MREYLLYVKIGEQGASAYVTPCFAVDKQYWEQREGQRLHVIGKSPSLALAFALRERVNRYVQTRRFTQETLAGARQMAEAYVRQANRLYVRESSAPPSFSFSFEPVADEPDPLLPDVDQEAKLVSSLLAGRCLLWEELVYLLQKRGAVLADLHAALQWLVLRGQAEWLPGVGMTLCRGWWRHRLRFVCNRCQESGAIRYTVCHSCRQACAYCEACLAMGRSKCCTPFLCGAVPPSHRSTSHAPSASFLAWSGSFTLAQARAAEQARRFINSPGQAFLIWAVCGAGKTELIFPAVDEVLRSGNDVLIATPRKDVVLELSPRLAAAFPGVRVLAVHGSSDEKWEAGRLVVATTHQTMRMYRRFSLVVVDEVDAFPYHGNRLLYRCVQRAVSPGGKLLYLSATPPRYLRKRLVPRARWSGGVPLSSGTHVLVPRRYHGYPLPVPQVVTVSSLRKRLAEGRPLPFLLESIQRSFAKERQVFIFVPRIEDVPVVLAYLQTALPAFASRMAGVHAADPDRERQVQAFRGRAHALLVTTTILERGVTIPRSDVIVLAADHSVFDRTSLVQIAGRVGRSADAPTGTVLFVAERRTRSIASAIREIRQMNRLAVQLEQREER